MTASATEKSRIVNLESRIAQIAEQDARDFSEKQDLEQRLAEFRSRLAGKEREIEELAARRNAAQEERMDVAARLEQALAKKKTLEAETERKQEQARGPAVASPLPA